MNDPLRSAANRFALDAAVRRFPFLIAGARRYGEDWAERYVRMRMRDIVQEYRIQNTKGKTS